MSNYPTAISVTPHYYMEGAKIVATVRLEPKFSGLKNFNKALAKGEAQVRQYLQEVAQYVSQKYGVTLNKPTEDLDVIQGAHHTFLVAAQPVRAGTDMDILADQLDEDERYGEDFAFGTSGNIFEGLAK